MALGERARRRDPDPQAGEAAGPDADGDAVDRVPARPGLRERALEQRQHARGVLPARPGRRVVARLERAAVGEHHAGDGGGARGVERGDDHRAASTSIERRSPPACASVTRRATARPPSSSSDSRPLGPLDERDRVRAEVRVEQPGVLVPQPGEPVEVEVRERAGRAVVEHADDERRARDRLGHAERPQRAAHERRLARAEVARDEHHVARPQVRGERGAGALGRLRPVASGRDAHAAARAGRSRRRAGSSRRAGRRLRGAGVGELLPGRRGRGRRDGAAAGPGALGRRRGCRRGAGAAWARTSRRRRAAALRLALVLPPNGSWYCSSPALWAAAVAGAASATAVRSAAMRRVGMGADLTESGRPTSTIAPRMTRPGPLSPWSSSGVRRSSRSCSGSSCCAIACSATS